LRNGQPVGNNTFTWGFDTMVERLKTPVINGSEVLNQYCIAPRLDLAEFFSIATGGAQLNPLEQKMPNQVCTGQGEGPFPGSTQCGEYVSHISTTDLDCWAERVFDQIGGFNRESVVVHAIHPMHPDLKMTFLYSLLDGDYNYTYFHPLGGQHPVSYRYVTFCTCFFFQKLVLTTCLYSI
jgi:hypothetical protein